MEFSGIGPVFLVACFGGVLVELWKWYQLKDSPNLDQYRKGPIYWILTIAMILAGGAIAVLYGTDKPTNGILLVNIGASAPAIIRALGATPAQKLAFRDGTEPVPALRGMSASPRNFLRAR